MKKMRLPNGYGQITKLKGNLRKPFRVRVVSERSDISGLPSAYRTLGTYKTYNDAYAALVLFHEGPAAFGNQTLSEVYHAWLEQAIEDGLSEKNISNIKSAWKHITIKNMPVADILPSHIRTEINKPNLAKTRPRFILSIFSRVLDYAESERLVINNPAKQVKLPKRIVELQKSTREKHAFTSDEIRFIASCGLPGSDVLFYSILSGWRPSEVLELTPESVNLEQGYVIGGIKTEAGRNRIVPIHPLVRPLLERCVEAKRETLFSVSIYNTYKYQLYSIFSHLDLPHVPHDARRTFVTLAKDAGMDEYALKRIVGHSIKDLTEKVYTDRPISWLQKEMRKIDLDLDKNTLSPYLI